jgi:hypothetical protein
VLQPSIAGEAERFLASNSLYQKPWIIAIEFQELQQLDAFARHGLTGYLDAYCWGGVTFRFDILTAFAAVSGALGDVFARYRVKPHATHGGSF